ncbi:protein refolding chaperone Spy/CpxP family [Janthinobacterium sp. OK676]|uniref:Spy/CpxP family protein refolding chaperone n=1 Tax=Janthinobacterium sp. OK676 TaxID=1855295 RepID=UPI00087F2E95|nr:periplasmic heavy metal sensor [Janthinobacterium sp. OK676]SDL59109.1 protein refolding chaperone Spy/CpxP family [Janthinobacterium sp. OK676]
MKYLSITVSLLLLSACSMPLLALAQQGPPPGLPPFLHGIELNDTQQDKVFAATYAQAPELREQEKIAFKAHEQLRALAASSAYDDAKASALANTAAQAMAKISLLHARLEQQLLAVLTPEQRQQAQQRDDARQSPRHLQRAE